MKAYWLEDNRGISPDTLRENGVLCEQLGLDEAGWRIRIDALKRTHGYIQEDVVELNPATPALDALCDSFIREHRHDDDEVRFVLEGEGIFDIRSSGDSYMRVEVRKGDLIVVPKERYHSFRLTDQRAIRCLRLFREMSGWLPTYRDL
jgi:1,2-dihydroxy-3-keto-5-methylthiopentene dioxygenase